MLGPVTEYGTMPSPASCSIYRDDAPRPVTQCVHCMTRGATNVSPNAWEGVINVPSGQFMANVPSGQFMAGLLSSRLASTVQQC